VVPSQVMHAMPASRVTSTVGYANHVPTYNSYNATKKEF